MDDLRNPIFDAIFKSTDLVDLFNRLLDVPYKELDSTHANGLFQSDKLKTELNPYILIRAEDKLYLSTPKGGIALDRKLNRKSGKSRVSVATYASELVDYIADKLGSVERSHFAIKSIEDFKSVYCSLWCLDEIPEVWKEYSNGEWVLDDLFGQGLNICQYGYIITRFEDNLVVAHQITSI